MFWRFPGAVFLRIKCIKCTLSSIHIRAEQRGTWSKGEATIHQEESRERERVREKESKERD